MKNQTKKSEATPATRNKTVVITSEKERIKAIFKPDLSQVSAEYLTAEIDRRMRAGECVGMILTPDDLCEYWECDDSGATHPGSLMPEAGEMHAIRKAFERWQDNGAHSEMMCCLRDAWLAEQSRKRQEGCS